MLDPLTALSVASTAVSQIQSLLSAGKDASKAISSFAGAWSDINYAEEKIQNPPWYKSFSGSAEKEALDIFVAKKKITELKNQVETMISYTYGATGLEQYKETLRKVKEQRRKHQYRKQEIKQNIIEFFLLIILIILISGIVIGGVYYVGVGRGLW